MLAVLEGEYFPIQHLLHPKIMESRLNLKEIFKNISSILQFKMGLSHLAK